MEVGPSKPACRSGLQTAISYFSPKGCGGERYGKSRDISRHVWLRETNESEPLKTHRNVLNDIKTRGCPYSGKSMADYLLTGHAVSGVQVA